MSRELINRITIKKDGVYISSCSTNDSRSYRSNKIKSLSKIYDKEGQRGLDKEIINMVLNYVELRGTHKSIERYRRLFKSKRYKTLYKKYIDDVNERYVGLCNEEGNTVNFKKSKQYEDYCQYEKEQKDIFLDACADLLAVA